MSNKYKKLKQTIKAKKKFYSKNAGIFGCIKIVLKFISTSQCSIVKSKKIFNNLKVLWNLFKEEYNT